MRFYIFICGLVLNAVGLSLDAVEPEKHILPLAKDMIRSDVYRADKNLNPQAVLILCPGYNGNGGELVSIKAWQDYANDSNLGLLGLSFASEPELFSKGRGYYYASNGSGEVLLRGIKKIYGRDLPILIYGFSGGAHFCSRFVEWSPKRIKTWCAYSAGWWDEPLISQVMPPGIVACGNEDERYGATLTYFLKGRAAGKPWTWVSLPKTGHSPSDKLDEFVRSYFTAILKSSLSPKGLWKDCGTKVRLTPVQVKQYPTLAVWLPTEDIGTKWEAIHHP